MEVEERIAYRLEHGGKTCHRCGLVKPVTQYSADTKTVDGLTDECRDCRA